MMLSWYALLSFFLVAVHGTKTKSLSTLQTSSSTSPIKSSASPISTLSHRSSVSSESVGFLVGVAPIATNTPIQESTSARTDVNTPMAASMKRKPLQPQRKEEPPVSKAATSSFNKILSSSEATFAYVTPSSTTMRQSATSSSSSDTFTPNIVFAPPLKSQPRILEITTHVTEPRGDLQGPHIDGIEAHLESGQHEEIEEESPKHRIPTAVEEKLEALSCEVPPLPSTSVLWNGNQTRDLKLPIMVAAECEPDELDCPFEMSLSWDATAEVQTGDVLLIRVDDHALIQQSTDDNLTSKQHHLSAAAVYQVSRSGHDHCDISDGTLLDITPLVVDGEKLITLYDKDLTEGINLLIVVSEQWGKQCVRLRISVKSDNCGENADCSNKGVCFSNASMDGFECECCPGFIGPHCEEKDACFPSPCYNNGICVDLSQGHEGSTYQCLCPYGYSGKQCQDEADPCETTPCRHGGRCHWNQTNYYCECVPGFVGEHCERSLDVCGENPCKNGLCVRQGEGYACFCKPGYAGDNCEFEYNECQSSPCENGATCADSVNGFQCICGRGYTGKRCQVKVDLCDPNPCAEGRFCVDRGNNYSCECPRGYAGMHCSQPVKAVCSDNPCHHGGTCWGSVSSFYCACSPGFTGKNCEQPLLEDEEPSEASEDEVPLAMRLEKLHNIYIAVGTLSCALLIVIIIVAVCHCRVQELYKKCFVHSTPLLPCKIRRLDLLPKQTWSGKAHFEQEREALTAQSRPFPSLDPTEVYYTLDFSGDQHSPLIQ